jgi:hypothetical protein
MGSTTHFAVEPGAGGGPVAPDGDGGHMEHFGGLIEGKAAKETHFHDLSLADIDLRKRLEGVIEGHDVNIFSAARSQELGVFER